MALGWSTRRQLLYYAVGLVILCTLAWVVWALFLNTAPTCFDGKQNGTELGVDCSGSCALICTQQSREPVVLWSRSFSVGGKFYTSAAYIQNPNVGAASRNVQYSFQLFDADNLLVVERQGVINLPPVQTIPIIEPNINVGNRQVAKTLFYFSAPSQWYKVQSDSIPTLRITQQNLGDDASVLSAMLVNNSSHEATNVTVAAVLFDNEGVARAASKSLISSVPAKSSQPIVFTWPGGVPNIVRAEITVLPAF